MNEIQKFYYDRMVAALYQAQAELMLNIKSENSGEYFKGEINNQLPSEIFNSFNELEDFIIKASAEFKSSVPTSLHYSYLQAHKHKQYALFSYKPFT